MKVPVIVRDTPNMGNMLTQYGAMICCAYWAEEADWNGQPPVSYTHLTLPTTSRV